MGQGATHTSSAFADRPAWHPDFRAARSYARSRAGEVAFAVVGPRGKLRGYRVADTAPAASVFKVMLLAGYLRLPGVRDHGPTRAGHRLLRPMIRRSDDIAATRIRDIVGARRLRRLARAEGMRHFHLHPVWGLTLTSPRDQARFLFRLRRRIPERNRHYAFRQLARIVPSQRWGIATARLKRWSLFFKGGWGSGTGRVDHQVALLRCGRRQFSVAIFTEYNPSHAYGKRTLRGVSRHLLRGLPRCRR